MLFAVCRLPFTMPRMRALWSGLLLALILGMAFGPSVFAPAEPADDELVLISPHWDGIREEFERAFKAHWLKESGGRVVRLVWLDLGGGGVIRRHIQERARKAAWEQGEGIGADVFFGGGTIDHEGFIKEGVLAAYMPPPGIVAEIPPQVNGQALRHPQGYWHAACLSGFGFVYNRLVLERARLPAPVSWTDLGAPAYFGWISCGDPTQSGSLLMAFEIVLQAYGWREGWGVLVRLTANARAFNEGGGSIPRDVSLGQAAAGPCIDFYAAAPVRRQGATHLEFVFPQGHSVITPDAIAIFRNAPNPKAAAAFVDFVLSESGQRIWFQKRGTPGGPVDFDLERLSVWPSLYTRGLPTYTVARPFEQGTALAYNEKLGRRRWNILKDLLRATVIDLHEDLMRTWEVVIRAGREGDLGQALGLPLLEEEELLKLGDQKLPMAELNRLRNRWTGIARERYRAIRKAAERGGNAPEFAPAKAAP